MRPTKYFMVDLLKTAILAMAVFVSANCYAKSLFLWKITSPNTTVWLYGTIHVGKADFYPLPQPVTDAFDQSQVLAVEINLLKPDMPASEVLRTSLLPEGDHLNKHVGSKNWEIIKQQLPLQYNMQADKMSRMSPWMFASTLAVLQAKQAGFDGSYGIDQYLIAQATKQQKEILSLESYALQLKQLSSLSDDTTTEWIMSLLDAKETARARVALKDMITAWKTGNTNQLADIMHDDSQSTSAQSIKDFEQKLLVERNPGMAKKIIKLLKGNKTVFVAVGSMHYAGTKNLISLLQKAGYRPVQQQLPD